MLDVFENVICPFCGNDIRVNCNKHIVDMTSHEKDMGTDIQWVIKSEVMNCPQCNNEIKLVGTVGIYPEETVEFVDVKFKKV